MGYFAVYALVSTFNLCVNQVSVAGPRDLTYRRCFRILIPAYISYTLPRWVQLSALVRNPPKLPHPSLATSRNAILRTTNAQRELTGASIFGLSPTKRPSVQKVWQSAFKDLCLYPHPPSSWSEWRYIRMFPTVKPPRLYFD